MSITRSLPPSTGRCQRDTEPTELEPLYDCVDPDALDALFRPLPEDRPRSHGRLSFSFDEYEVAVHGHGEIIVDVSDINTSEGERGGGRGGGIKPA